MRVEAKFYKIGGSCLTGPDSIREFTRHVPQFGKSVFVLSAFAGITDSLLDCVVNSQSGIEDCINGIADRHISMLQSAIGRPPDQQSIDRIYGSVSHIENLFLNNDTHSLNTDAISSCGERLSASTCTSYLNEIGEDAHYVSADTLGLLASSNGNGYYPDVQLSSESIQERLTSILKTKRIVVTTGYFGQDLDGIVRTFGRNSSDYSAVAIAAASGSDEVTLLKDVDGIYSSDPKKFQADVRKFDVLSHENALLLSQSGFRIVHPGAIELARQFGITIRVRAYQESEFSGTLISSSL